ncbi:MAG: bacteriocin [Lachnospiraceae bacterium]
MAYEMQFDENGLPVAGIAAVLTDMYKDTETGEENSEVPEILPKYKELHALNPDLIGRFSLHFGGKKAIMKPFQDERSSKQMETNKELNEKELSKVSGGDGNPETGRNYKCMVCKTVFPASPGTVNSCPFCSSRWIDTEYEG